MAEFVRIGHHLIAREKADDAITGDADAKRHRSARIAAHRFADDVLFGNFREFLARGADEIARSDDENILAFHQPLEAVDALTDEAGATEHLEKLLGAFWRGERPKTLAVAACQYHSLE